MQVSLAKKVQRNILSHDLSFCWKQVIILFCRHSSGMVFPVATSEFKKKAHYKESHGWWPKKFFKNTAKFPIWCRTLMSCNRPVYFQSSLFLVFVADCYSLICLGVVRASNIFPILSAILLLMGGVCIAASRFYKSKRNIILGAGILFVAAGKWETLLMCLCADVYMCLDLWWSG